ncbi:MAG: hypothetical protein NTW28_06875 [Candidatus Solibacter sp.]|nr:hypothetical protein [Candidatus Solibacter sp.]
MRYMVFLAAVLAARAQTTPRLSIYAEGTPPKASAAEYPVHAKSGNLAIGAEYMVHSFGSGEQMYLAENYLVVEVALFPPKGEGITADAAKFALRVNGKKTLLYAQNPPMVASNLNRRDWNSPRGPTADLGMGGVSIGLGYPQSRNPVPGAPDDRRRLPSPPRAPDAGAPGGGELKERVRPEDVLIRTALPEDAHNRPVSGFLYFPFEGKTSGLKSIDLLFQDAVMKLK